MDVHRHGCSICGRDLFGRLHHGFCCSQLEYLVNNSNSRFLLVENDEQLDKFLQVRDQMPDLIKVIVIERDGLHGFTDPQIIFLDELYEIGAEYDAAHPPSV